MFATNLGAFKLTFLIPRRRFTYRRASSKELHVTTCTFKDTMAGQRTESFQSNINCTIIFNRFLAAAHPVLKGHKMPPVLNYTVLYPVCSWGKRRTKTTGLLPKLEIQIVPLSRYSSQDWNSSPQKLYEPSPEGATLISTQGHGDTLSEVFPFLRKQG